MDKATTPDAQICLIFKIGSRVVKKLTHLPEGRLVKALRFTLDLLFVAEASLPFPAGGMGVGAER